MQNLDFNLNATYLCRNGSKIKITEIDVGPLSTYITGHPISEPKKLLFWRGNGNSMITQEFDLMQLAHENWRYEEDPLATDAERDVPDGDGVER